MHASAEMESDAFFISLKCSLSKKYVNVRTIVFITLHACAFECICMLFCLYSCNVVGTKSLALVFRLSKLHFTGSGNL